MIALISIILILAGILLVAVVFIQNPKGGGLSNDFGAQQLGGVQRANDFVEKSTWTLAVVIVGLSFVLSSMMKPAAAPKQPQGQGQEQGQGQPGQGQGQQQPQGNGGNNGGTPQPR